MTAPAPTPTVDPAAPTAPAPTPQDPAAPADLAGYQDLVTKLRDEIKAAKEDHTPQDAKDAATIAVLKRQLKDAEPILAQWQELEQKSKTDLERAQDAAAKEKERATGLVKRAVVAEIKAAAIGFADSSDAVVNLDPAKYANDDGEIDTKLIESDLADLLKRKPHLASGRTPTLPPNPAQGTGNNGAPSLDGQIVDAEKAGNYALAISLKRQKAAQAA